MKKDVLLNEMDEEAKQYLNTDENNTNDFHLTEDEANALREVYKK